MGINKMAAPQVSVQVGASAPPPQGFGPPPQQGYAPPPYQGFGPPPPQQAYAPPTQQPVANPPAQLPLVVQVGGGGAQQLNSSAPVQAVRWDKHPVTMTCPHCQKNITTAPTTSVGWFAWLIGLGIFTLSGGFLCPCAFIPCCIDDCKDFTHRCPSCNRVLGSYSKI